MHDTSEGQIQTPEHTAAAGGLHVVLISLYHFGAFGPRTLSDVLKKSGHTVSMVFFKRDKTNEMALPTAKEYKLLKNLIKDLSPGLVGISTRSAFFPVARDITAALKPEITVPVIWGGAHAIICPEECIRYADIVCAGEGEGPLPLLADAILNKKDHTRIPGLWTKGVDGSVIQNETCPVTEHLDALPLPDFSDVSGSYVIEDDKCENREPLYNDSLTYYNFMSGRGCPFRCDFCSNSVFHSIFKGKGGRLRQRSVDNVIRELLNAKRAFKNLAWISSNDELFGQDAEWLREFSERYKREIGLAFHCDIHPSYVTEEKISALSGMGLKTISMGLQSGSERIRREVYGRNTPDAMILNAAGLFRKYKIFPSYDLIFDNPLETVDDLRKTLDFMMRLPRPFRMCTYSLQYHPKTALTEKLLSMGIITEKDVDGVSLKGFSQWHIRTDLRTNKKDVVFLQRLFLMLGSYVSLSKKKPNRVISLFPRWFIVSLDKSPLFRNNLFLTGWVKYLPKATFAAGLILQLDFAGFFSRLRRRLDKTRPG
ncbi:MAG: radical SAM protein [Elusimicrobiota bacterium]